MKEGVTVGGMGVLDVLECSRKMLLFQKKIYI